MTFPSLAVRAQGKTRANFAVQHLLAAARFARICYRIEQDNIGNPLGPFFDEIMSFVSAGVLSSVASMEANINEQLADHPQFMATLKNRGFEQLWNKADAGCMLEKYQFALDLFGHSKIPRGEPLFQNAAALVDMRNRLVHFRPEWNDDSGKHKKVGELLANRFQRSPFVSVNAPLFPIGCMCHACLKWAIETSLGFMKEFSERMGLPFKFGGSSRNFSTT